jgi:hypothetical protein
MFKPSDVKRVGEALNAAVPLPYEVEISLSKDRLQMSAQVMDPDNADLPVCQCMWRYSAKLAKLEPQPGKKEVAEMATAMANACASYQPSVPADG